jgi:menaquinol-cytochrome c reductase iron-sulfur subunit
VTHSGETIQPKDANNEGCAACVSKEVAQVSRRSFFGALVGMGSLVIGAIVGTPLLRFVLYPVYAKSKSSEWSDVGDISEFEKADVPVSKTISLAQRDGWREVVSIQSVYVNRTAEGQLQVLSAICPHLGCSVAWQANQGKFVCPCHGGQFHADGRHISGPPPRSLDNLKAQVKDGKLQVQFEYFRSNVPDQESLS